jgi:hypothetical protein
MNYEQHEQQTINNLAMKHEQELIFLHSQMCSEGDRLVNFDSLRDTLQDLLDRIVRLEETVYEQPKQPEPVLESLDEHNKRALGIFGPTNLECKVKNGIACPNCGAELFDSNIFVKLSSYPPQYRTHCESCDYEGTRY